MIRWGVDSSGFEHLEARHLLTGTASSVVKVIDTSDSSIVIRFESADFCPDWWEPGDIQLYRVLEDQTRVPIFGPMEDPETIEPYPSPRYPTSPTTAELDLSGRLAPGTYEVVLQQWGFLSMMLADSDPCSGSLWDPGEDQFLSQFSIAALGRTIDDAVDLGVAGSSVQIVSGALGAPGSAESYALYKITLTDQADLWRLGLQLDPTGQDFTAALALFDATGHVLTTRDAGSGLPNSPDSPFLLTGLLPGDYYIGVSGAGNLPGHTWGYDPIRRAIGTSSRPQSGGSFQLQFVADAARPTVTTGFTLNWADEYDRTPTGVTLTFSDGIDPMSLEETDSPWAGVVAVDEAGKTWRLTPTGDSALRGRVSFVFDERLPAGTYQLHLPEVEGLTDLLGRPPSGPGLPANVLATFEVLPCEDPSSSHDLGVIWPGLPLGVERSTTLVPDDPGVFRVVIPISGDYFLKVEDLQDALTIDRVGPGGWRPLDIRSLGITTATQMYLEAGVYLFKFLASGSQPEQLTWSIRLDHKSESLSSSGVGQSSALNLRLVDPLATRLTMASQQAPLTVIARSEPPFQQPVGDPPPPGADTDRDARAPGSMPAAAESSTSMVASPVPTVLLVGLNTPLLGRPAGDAASGQAESSPSTTGALADPTRRGIGTLVSDLGGGLSPEAVRPEPGAPDPEPDGTGSMAAELASRARESIAGDLLALRRAEGVVDAANQLAGWFWKALEGDSRPPEPVRDELLARLLEGHGPGQGVDEASAKMSEDRIERAQVGVPLTAVLAAAAAYRLRHWLGRWWRPSPSLERRTHDEPRRHRGWSGPHRHAHGMHPGHRGSVVEP